MWETQSYNSAQSQHSGASLLDREKEKYHQQVVQDSSGPLSHSPAGAESRGKFSLRQFTSAMKGSATSPSQLPSSPSSPTFASPSRRRSPPPPIATLPSPSHFLHPSPQPQTSCPPPTSPSPPKLATKSSQISLSSSQLAEQPGGLRGKAARILGEDVVPSGKAAKVMGVTVQKEIGAVGRKVDTQITRERREVVERIRRAPSAPNSPLPPSLASSRPPLASAGTAPLPTTIPRSRAPAPAPLWLPLPPPTVSPRPYAKTDSTLPAPSSSPVPSPSPAGASTTRSRWQESPPSPPSQQAEFLSLFPVPHARTPSPSAISPRRFSSIADTSSPPPSASSLSPTSPNSSAEHRTSDVDPALSFDRLFAGETPVGLSHPSHLSTDSSACGLEGLEFTTSGLSSEVNSPAGEDDLPQSPRMSYFSSFSRGESSSALTVTAPRTPPAPPLPSAHDRKTGFPSFLSHSPPPRTPPPPLPPRSSSRPSPQPLNLNRSGAVASARTRGVQRGNALEALEGRRGTSKNSAVGGGGRGKSKPAPVPSKPAPKPTPTGKSFLDWSSDEEPSAAPAPLASHWSAATAPRQTVSSPLDPFFSHRRPPLPSITRSTPPPAPLAARSLTTRPPAALPHSGSLPSLSSSSKLASTASSTEGGGGNEAKRMVPPAKPVKGGEGRRGRRPSMESGLSWLDSD